MSFSTKLKKNHKNVHSYVSKMYILLSIDYHAFTATKFLPPLHLYEAVQ